MPPEFLLNHGNPRFPYFRSLRVVLHFPVVLLLPLLLWNLEYRYHLLNRRFLLNLWHHEVLHFPEGLLLLLLLWNLEFRYRLLNLHYRGNPCFLLNLPGLLNLWLLLRLLRLWDQQVLEFLHFLCFR